MVVRMEPYPPTGIRCDIPERGSRTRRPETAWKALKRTGALLSILCLFASGGCGYHFVPEGSPIDPSLRSIFVTPFPNRTDEPVLGNLLREALILELRKAGRFELAGGPTDEELKKARDFGTQFAKAVKAG